MTRVFAFIGGGSQVGQSTIAAELAFAWVKCGASACVLTAKRRIEAMGFDCFELAGLAPRGDRGQRNPAALAADLAELEDYDYFLLDLPPGSIDLAVAAGLSGAELVVPISVDQGALGEVGPVFRELARRPPRQSIHLVLNRVGDVAAATDAAQRLMARLERKLKLSTRLAATLPWDRDLAALNDPSTLPSMTLPKAPLAGAIPLLADTLIGEATKGAPTLVAMVFWEQFQTLLQHPGAAKPIAAASAKRTAPASAKPTAAASAERTAPASAKPTAAASAKPTAAAQATATAAAPELTAELARIAAGLEQLNEEVRRLRHGLAGQLGVAEDGEGEGQEGAVGEPIRLDFEAFRRSRDKAKTDTDE
jgi:hypothetical protein